MDKIAQGDTRESWQRAIENGSARAIEGGGGDAKTDASFLIPKDFIQRVAQVRFLLLLECRLACTLACTLACS